MGQIFGAIGVLPYGHAAEDPRVPARQVNNAAQSRK
jgi:hypothetical protein